MSNQIPKYRRVIHWFRRDLRLTDNTALHQAHKNSQEIIPAYVVSDWAGQHAWTGPARQEWLCRCLSSLSKNIEYKGSALRVRRGEIVQELIKLAKQYQVEAIFFNQDPDPFGHETERRLALACRGENIDVHGFKDHVLHSKDEVLTKNGEMPYRVFTPYSKVWRQLPKQAPVAAPEKISSPPLIQKHPLPELGFWMLPATSIVLPEAGERAALERLKHAITQIIPQYAKRRDTPSSLTTSRLSPDLRMGTISIRKVYHYVSSLLLDLDPEVQLGASTYIGELAWREFYMALLGHFPDVLKYEFNPDWRGLPWLWDSPFLDAWKSGNTGFPLVDAGMRELLATGLMHNRIRMVVSMFLTKDLHVDWRVGEQFFMQHLIDGEIASNNGGWQWSAGTGADAAPYFRIQNPWSQSAKYDPEATYIKTWIPELIHVPSKLLHSPPSLGKSFSPNYPRPIVDHATERLRTLEIFKKHRIETKS